MSPKELPAGRPAPETHRQRFSFKDLAYTPLWNVVLIVAGSALYAFGAKSVVLAHGFITGGIFGASLLLYYLTDFLSAGTWSLLLNLPLFAVAWVFLSRRFLLYSLLSIFTVALCYELIEFDLGINEQFYAALAGGVICGGGSGIILRSLGSGGGLDVIAILLNRKFNFSIGKFYMIFNVILFSFSLTHLSIDLFIASVIFVFVSSVSLDYVLSMFSQRKLTYIISKDNPQIARALLERGWQATIIKAKGAYSGKDQDILMTITNNIYLKQLEEMVFTVDQNAIFVVENTFNVLGSVFGRRKQY
jgi:uncharacterized membrane-anchored protein YitT (DUF2179 family)